MKEPYQVVMNNKATFSLSFVLLLTIACNRKIEDIEAPTMGKLTMLADESIRDIVQQEEEIFERNYPYAQLTILYTNEYDMFSRFMADSVDVAIATRTLTAEETDYLGKRQSIAHHYPFATGAVAFIANRNARDTTYTYENLKAKMADQSSGSIFVIENVKSGIAREVLQFINLPALPGHFYALPSKKEVLAYVQAHDNAIGVIDYSDISDTDNSFTREVLESIRLLGVSRPQDSIQAGFVKPFQYNLQDRKYPFTRDLYVITKTGRSDVGIGFASFICGEIGQKIILKAGLLPKFQTERSLEINPSADIKVVK
jgi:phosphate transport system substrate-binding protein